MAIAEALHITPREQREGLTVEEFLDACDYIDRLIEAQKRE